MTKWNTGENRHANYSSLSNSLIMLAFMTSGYGSCSLLFELSRYSQLSIAKVGINICMTSECLCQRLSLLV